MQLETKLFIMLTYLLLCLNFDVPAFTRLSLPTYKRLNEQLISSSDYLVKSELKLAHKVVASIIVYIFKIVNVIDYNFEVVSFFKKILDVKAPDPFRFQVVINNFSLSYLVPS